MNLTLKEICEKQEDFDKKTAIKGRGFYMAKLEKNKKRFKD